VFDPSLVSQHLAMGPAAAAGIQPWQVINLVGGPLAAILLLPPILEDLDRWWRSRTEERAEVDRTRPRDS
jgi:hypothetical protein